MSADVKERGILFSAPMVKAILDGSKTETRRMVKPQPPKQCINYGVGNQSWLPPEKRDPFAWIWETNYERDPAKRQPWHKVRSPYGGAGERLWVRETYYQLGHWEPVPGVRTKAGREKWRFVPDGDVILFEAPAEFRKGRHHKDPGTVAWHKRLGRFMPRAASRITLEIDEVRVERLHDIDEEGARAEGVAPAWLDVNGEDVNAYSKPTYRQGFARLWRDLNGDGPGSWDANPWVWVLRFHRIDAVKTTTREAAHA